MYFFIFINFNICIDIYITLKMYMNSFTRTKRKIVDHTYIGGAEFPRARLYAVY
jgi:hypothetical protein